MIPKTSIVPIQQKGASQLELHITLTYSDPADERPWFAECQELPLTGEGNTPWQALDMLQEMGELYFQSLYETGGWERAIGQLKT